MKAWIKHSAIVVAALSLAACSAVPDRLQVANEDALVAYETVLETPNANNGETARWGGVIADVKNSDAGTVIEVVNFPLNSWGRPVPGEQSSGRFRATLNGFVDPMVYTQGSEVTFTGTVAGVEKGTIGEYNYLFPLLNVSAKYLWPERKEKAQMEVNYDALWYRHYYYTRPFYPSPVYIPGPVMKEQPKQGNN